MGAHIAKDWNQLSEREKMIWAASFSAGVAQSWTAEACIERANRAVDLLRTYAPEGESYR